MINVNSLPTPRINLPFSAETKEKASDLLHVLGLDSLSALVAKLVDDKHRACSREIEVWRKAKKAAELKQ